MCVFVFFNATVKWMATTGRWCLCPNVKAWKIERFHSSRHTDTLWANNKTMSFWPVSAQLRVIWPVDTDVCHDILTKGYNIDVKVFFRHASGSNKKCFEHNNCPLLICLFIFASAVEHEIFVCTLKELHQRAPLSCRQRGENCCSVVQSSETK